MATRRRFLGSRILLLSGLLSPLSALVPVLPARATITPAAFTGVFASSLTANWTSTYSSGTLYYVQASTASNYSSAVYSSNTLNLFAPFLGLAANTSYYARVSSQSGGPYTDLGVAVTAVETPMAVVFDEISTHSIVAAAYAPGAAFSRLEAGVSGIAVARDGVYAGFRNGNVWTARAPMPTARELLAAAAVRGRVYAVGGYNGSNISKNEEYDPATNSWTTQAPMPTARFRLAAASAGDRVYVVGGWNGSMPVLDQNEEFDPASNSWATRAPLPQQRVFLDAAAVNGRVYALGGLSVTNNDEYSPESDSWTGKAPVPVEAFNTAAAALGGKVYRLGGVGSVYLDRNDEYDPGTNSWTGRAPMPTARSRLAAAAVGGKLYAVGGYDGSMYRAENEAYDPASNSWMSRVAMPTPRGVLSAAAAGGRLYAVGGNNAAALALNEEYDPGVSAGFAGLQPNTLYAFKARARNRIGVETGESVTVSTYTLAAVSMPSAGTPLFSGVSANGVVVNWSSGTAVGGYNGPGATYRVQASTKVGFIPVLASSLTANVFATVSGLQANATHYFRVRAYNAAGVTDFSWLVLGSTRTTSAVSTITVSGFTAVFASSLTANWSSTYPPGTLYYVRAATASNYSGTVISSNTLNQFATLSGLTPNASYYARVSSQSGGPYTDLGIAVTAVESPTAVVFDEISTHSIVAAAYAPTPAFTGLNQGQSGMNVFGPPGVYAGWRGERWTSKAAMPTARDRLAAAVSGGKVYAVGGYNGPSFLAHAEEYDPTTNSWSTKATMPTARSFLAAAAVDGKVYAVGGSNDSILYMVGTEAYDPKTNAWSNKNPMPTARYSLAAAGVGGKFFAIGGYNSSYRTQTEEYDPATDAWTNKAAMPTARYDLAAAAVGGKIYAVGGDNNGVLTQTEEYDPAANAWASRAAMPTARSGLAAAAVGGKLFAVGGRNNSTLAQVEEFDPSANAWTSRAVMPTARFRLAIAAVGGRLYAVGGSAGPFLTQTEEYDPGVAVEYKGLQPNTLYSFKAKARNRIGIETGESVTVSTYTQAAVGMPLAGTPLFSGVSANSAVVNWSSGTAAGGFNGPGATYLVQASTKVGFVPVLASSLTANVFAAVSGLQTNATHYFRVQAYNAAGVTDFSWLVLGSTMASAAVSTVSASAFTAVFASSLTANWSSTYPPGTPYYVQAATAADYSGTVRSSDTQNLFATITSLTPNASYYARVSTQVAGPYADLGLAVTAVETPTAVVFDEISTHSIVAAAYAPAPAFTRLEAGASGVGVARNGAYAEYRNGNAWTTRAAMPAALNAHAAVGVGGKVLVVGGFNGSGARAVNEEYDPALNAWTSRASMPTARYFLAAAVVGSKLYAVGGSNGADLSLNEEYDPETDSWVSRRPMPTPRNTLAAISLGKTLYAIGGHNGTHLAINEEYDPSGDAWTTRAAMPTVRRGPGAVVVGQRLFVVGGTNPGALGVNEEYDPSVNVWASRAAMPTARGGLQAVAVGSRFYAIGGGNGSYLPTNEEYDVGADTWNQRTPMFTARSVFGAAAARGRIYVVGGGNGFNLAVNEEYDPGVAAEFRGLQPNTQYSFKAKARNRIGVETGESITVSTYTLATVSMPLAGTPLFSGVSANSAVVNWSSGTNAGGFNGPGATYLVQASTMAGFMPVLASSLTANVSAVLGGLQANATHYFRVRAYNAAGVTDYSWFVLGSAVTSSTSAVAGVLFSTDTVDGAGIDVGFFPSMAADQNGDLHVAYYDSTSQDLRYVKRTGTAWGSPQVVDSAGNVGGRSSLAIDAGGFPHIAYQADQTIKYARFTGSSWSFSVVDAPTLDALGSPSLALDGFDRPHLYYADFSFTLAIAKYARFDGVAWSTRAIDSVASGTSNGSLVLTPEGLPRIIYGSRYARFDGVSWSTSSPFGGNSVEYPPPVLDADGVLHVAYYPNRYGRYDGVTWSTMTFDSTAPAGDWDLALDGLGKPHVAYLVTPPGGGYEVRYASFSVAWTTSTVESLTSAGIWLSFAMDKTGNPHVAYQDNTLKDLKTAHWTGPGFSPPMGGGAGGKAQAPLSFRATGVFVSSITWAWSDNASNELGFRLYGATSESGPYSLVAGTQTIAANQTSFTEAGLSAGTSYYRYIAAVNAGGVVTSSGAAAMPAVPTSLRVWDGGGASSNASEAANWVGDVAPRSGDSVLFDASGPKGCRWDLAITIASMTVSAGYGGTVRLSSNVIVAGDLVISSGGLNIPADNSTVTIQGRLFYTAPGTLHWHIGRLRLGGDLIGATTSGSALNGAILELNGSTLQTLAGGPGSALIPRLEVASSSDVQVNRQGIIVNGSLTLASGRLNLSTASVWVQYGDWLQTGGQLLAGSSTVTFAGAIPGTQTVTALPGNPFANLQAGLNPSTVRSLTPLDVDGNLRIAAGLLDLGTFTHTVGGDWLHAGGVFSPSSGTIVLDGNAKASVGQLAGSRFNGLQIAKASTITFTNSFAASSLADTVSNSALVFPAGSTATVGTLTLGAGGLASRVRLRGSAPGSSWFLVLTGTASVARTDVQDSDARGGLAVPAAGADNLDSGGNFNWDFGGPVPLAPGTPLGAALGVSSIAWSWAASPGAEFYRVFAASDALNPIVSPATAAFLHVGLSPNSTYAIRVAAVGGGNTGPLSPAATAHTLANPPAGSAVSGVHSASATLSWSLNGNPSATVAELARSTDGAVFTTAFSGPATYYLDVGLLGCTSYYYRVRNKNADGVPTGFDGLLNFKTRASTPVPPGDFTAESLPGGRIGLAWTPSPTEGIVGYRLYHDSGTGTVDYSSPLASLGPAATSYLSGVLASGTLYKFGLRTAHRCGVQERNTSVVASAAALAGLAGVRAAIKVPASGKRVKGNRVLVMAELLTGESRDVSNVRFQYRASSASAWADIPAANLNHPNPDGDAPYFVHWDVTALTAADYDLRAVAAGVLGSSDPAPGSITIAVDPVTFDISETDLGGGRVKKEQLVHSGAANTVAAAESGSAVVTKVMIPAGAIDVTTATVTVVLNPPATPSAPADVSPVGAAIEITLSHGQSQLAGGQSAALVFNYPDANDDGVVDGTVLAVDRLEIQTFDPGTNRWRKEFDPSVDKQAKTVTGRTPHFTFFALFAALAGELGSVRVYPNPYKPNGGNADEGKPFSPGDPTSGIVFDNLPASVSITIYTLTGKRIAGFGTEAGTGALQWDVRNDQGEDVASGGYFAVIKSPGQKPIIRKLGVIR